jgi:hypothetical protein
MKPAAQARKRGSCWGTSLMIVSPYQARFRPRGVTSTAAAIYKEEFAFSGLIPCRLYRRLFTASVSEGLVIDPKDVDWGSGDRTERFVVPDPRRAPRPEASIADLATWLLKVSEDEETAFLIRSDGRLWSPTGIYETHHEDEGRPGWLIDWGPYPETDAPRAREFARRLLDEAPPWQPVVCEFAPDECRALQWPGGPYTLDDLDDVPAVVLDLEWVLGSKGVP